MYIYMYETNNIVILCKHSFQNILATLNIEIYKTVLF